MDTHQEHSFVITGMDCATCAATIETGVSKLTGVGACTVNLTTARLRVQGAIAPESIIARVAELGYGAALGDGSTLQRAGQSRSAGVGGFMDFLLSRRQGKLAAAGALLVLPSLLLQELLPLAGVRIAHPLLDAASILALIVAGWPIARSAWAALTVNREININVLMTIAAIGAVIIGAYAESALVMVLFSLGETLEGFTMEQARRSIQRLMEVAPTMAVVLRPCMECQAHLGRDGYTGGPCPFCGVEETAVPVAAVRVGEIALVKPGESIAVDGRVRSGVSAVNQAPISGESLPVEKYPGSEVFAGTLNGEGALEIEVTRLAADSTISRIVTLVQEAEERRAPAQRFVDAFAAIYTPAVVGVAVLVAVAPPLLTGQPFWGYQGWLYRALELLVVACPCALVLSTPVTLISAISNAASNGVLIKGGLAVEAFSKVRALALDKTGTVTKGEPSVVRVRSVACEEPVDSTATCAHCDDLLALANAVERRSEHPVARAVVNAAAERGVSNAYAPADEVVALVGKGVRGLVAGRDVVIANHGYFDSLIPHTSTECAAIERNAANGETPLLVGVSDAYAGFLTVSDELRASSRSALQRLQADGIASVTMLTGDGAAAAQRIAQQIGITDVRSNLLPQQKLEAIHLLRAQYGQVAMVGDGINDAPALAAATVGIAVGAGGATQASETADMVLLGDGLSKLPFAYNLCRAAMRTIRVNVIVSIGIKLLFFVLVLLGLGAMWLAVLADVGVAMLVTLNGMRLLRFRDGKVEVGSRKSEVGSRKSEVGSRK